MKIKIKNADLIKALTITTKIMKAKPSTPIFGMNHFITKDNSLTVKAMEINESAETSINAEVTVAGEFLTNPKILLTMLKNIDNDEDIILSCNETSKQLNIQYGWNISNIPLGDNVQNYPSLQENEQKQVIEIATDKLKAIIQDTIFACSNDQSRLLFTGACITLDDNTRFIATNTHIMALATTKTDSKGELKKIIVPATALTNIVNTNIEDKTVKFFYDGHWLYINFDKTTYATNLIQGVFPDVDRVIPKQFNAKCKVNKIAFEKALARTKIFAEKDTQTVILRTNKEEQTLILSTSSTLGNATEAIKLDNLQIANDDIVIGFNADYLTQISKRIKGKDLYILIDTNFKPAIMSQDENNEADTSYVITPMRIAA